MSDLLSIGSSGVRSYQRALATVSNNISNAENPDYVRRDLRLGELSISDRYDPYHNVQVRFGGVDTSGVTRSYDPFLEAGLRFTGAALYSAETNVRWMEAIESSLNDGEHSPGAQFTSVFTAAEELASAPFNQVLRDQFIDNINASVTALNRTANNLSQISDQIFGAAQQEVSVLNEALDNLAKINIGLRGTASGSAKQANLLDERDSMLAIISERLDVTIEFQEHGVSNLNYHGDQLVGAGDANLVEVLKNIDGTLQLSSGTGSLATPLQGSLAALTASANTNSHRRSELDSIAVQFADEINNWQANGRTDSGNAGSPLLDSSGGAAGLSMLSIDPSVLALAATGGASNGNILNLSSLRNSSGLEQSWANVVGSQSVLTASAQSQHASSLTHYEAAREARDNLSSVDLDREAADLIRFQQAYDASARVIQVARETMQSIFAIF